MGGFARVAVPVVAAIAAPYALAGMGVVVPGMTTVGAWTTSASLNTLYPIVTPVFSWGNVAMAGLGGLANAAAYQRQQQAAYNQAVARNQQLTYMYQQQEIRDKRRRNKVRRLAAAKRARMGAMGVDPSAGSAAALLNGLQKRAENEMALEHDALDNKRQSLLAASHPRQQNTGSMLVKSLSPVVSLLEEQ